jgi:multidrug resistance efflux pump
MPDNTYQPKVYKKQPGDTLVVASGGAIDIETGGVIKANGTQAGAIVNLTDSTTGTADNTVADVGGAFSQATLNNNFADIIAKVNGILTAIRNAGIIP